MRRFEGRIALITGGAAGIGQGIAERLAAEGAKVVIGDIDAAKAEAVAAGIVEAGGEAEAHACDVAKGQDVSAVLRSIERTHGRLDCLINNAGLNVRGDFRHMSDADWEAIREVNLDGVVRFSRDALPLLQAAEGASIVNLASIMGHRGLRQLVGYSATKGAVAALTRALAVEYGAFGIRVNALAPGFIDTALTNRVLRNPMMSKVLLDQTPLRRFGTPGDIAGAVAFLCSDDAAFITGAELAIDGGMAAGL